MSGAAVALKHLMAAGLTGDALVAAVAEIQAAITAEVAGAISGTAQPIVDTRSKAAIRQENYRKRKAAEASQSVTKHNECDACDAETVTGVTDVTIGDACDVTAKTAPSLPLPPNEINSNPPAPTHPEGSTRARGSRGKKQAPVIELPAWMPVEQWDAFIDMRVRKGAVPTERAMTLLVGKLDRMRASGQDPGAVLDQSTLKNWTDLYDLKDPENGNRSQADRRNGAGAPRSANAFTDYCRDQILGPGSDGAGATSGAAGRQPDGAARGDRQLPLAGGGRG